MIANIRIESDQALTVEGPGEDGVDEPTSEDDEPYTAPRRRKEPRVLLSTRIRSKDRDDMERLRHRRGIYVQDVIDEALALWIARERKGKRSG